MSDTLKPALSADEWARKEHITEDADVVTVAIVGGRLDVMRHVTSYGEKVLDGRVVIDDQRSVIAVLALANAALPDDSPYKITRHDVADLVRFGENALWRADATLSATLSHIATKLAAILPPEPR
jgi:hypothetical protein